LSAGCSLGGSSTDVAIGDFIGVIDDAFPGLGLFSRKDEVTIQNPQKQAIVTYHTTGLDREENHRPLHLR
jgi:hypothetical protein